MLPLLLLVHTPKANIPSISQYFHQHGLSLDNPKLPSDQIRLRGEDYLNPHYPSLGGFRRASMATREDNGNPTQVATGQVSTPMGHHTQEEQEGIDTNNGKPLFFAPGPPTPADSDTLAWKRLISHASLPNEVISLIGEIFTSKDEIKMICDLRGDDAQTFINVIHEVCFAFFPSRNTTWLTSILFGSFASELSTYAARLWISLTYHHAFEESV